MKCIFCAIIQHEIPANILYEDDQVVAFADINPVAPTHLLIVPRRHSDSLSSTGEGDILAGLLLTARKLAADLNLEDYRVVINNGPSAGQSVFHLHVHLLGGRDFAWPPG